MGLSFGVITSTAILIHFTIDMDPMISWTIMSLTMGVFAIYDLVCISEPPDYKKKSGGLGKQVGDLVGAAVKACKFNNNLIFGFFLECFSGGPMVMFQIFIMSWLQRFVDDLPSFSDDDLNRLYQYQSIAGSAASFLLLGPVGSLSDRIHPKIMLPASFLIRGVFYFLVYLI